MMSNYLSNKIRILSFVSIILVVLLHNQSFEYATGIDLFLQTLITAEITRVAVPIFFFFSGFLFFVKCTKFTTKWYFSKIKTRIRSLLLPYLIWSCIGFICVLLIQSKQPQVYSSGGLVSQYSIHNTLYSLFWKPIGCYQLWFIRDLFCTALLSPILYYAIRFFNFYFVIVLFFIWMREIQFFVSIDAIFFFTLGSYVAVNQREMLEAKNESKFSALLLGISWLSVCILNVSLDLNNIWHCIGICIGLLFIWTSYDLISNNYIKKIIKLKIIYYTFFIYLLHEPIMTIIKGLLLKLILPKVCIALVYVITFLATIICTYLIGFVIKTKLPKLYSILSGNR